MRFTKMQGAGNDYIYVNGFQENIKNPERLAIELSDRHFGVGSDGLVIILPSKRCDFKMRMFNPDGSEAEMCGNASRCIGKYVYDKGLTDKKEITLETKAGIKKLKFTVTKNKVKNVCVDMGEPIISPSLIPVSKIGDSIIGEPFSVGDEQYKITCISMGNPHTVIFLESFDNIDLHQTGYSIEHHPLFPQRTNIEFAIIESKNNIRMRVWERGTGETLACGTGACATLVAAVLNGFAERKAVLHLLGGDLLIEWNDLDNHIYMTGDAITVFEGETVDRF